MIRSKSQDKYIQTGLDVGSNKICCAITEIDPNSNTPLVILFMYALSFKSIRLLMLKSGSETSERIFPLFTFISIAALPLLLKIS